MEGLIHLDETQTTEIKKRPVLNLHKQPSIHCCTQILFQKCNVFAFSYVYALIFTIARTMHITVDNCIVHVSTYKLTHLCTLTNT